MKKILLTITLIAMFGLLMGCEIKKIDVNGPNGQTNITDAATKDWPENRLLTIDGIESDYREALVYLLAAKEEAELLYGAGIWEKVLDENGTTYGELKKQQVLDEFLDTKIVCAHAAEYNIALFEEENRNVTDYTEEFIEKVGREKLIEYNITSELIKTLYTNNIIATKINEVVTLSVNVEVSDEELRQATIQQIFKSKYKTSAAGRKIPLDGNSLKALKETVQELRNTGAKKEDFKAFAEQNTDDKSNIEMKIVPGTLEQSFENVIFSLNVGEVSPVLENDEGYYIFKVTATNDAETVQKMKEDLIAQRREGAFKDLFESWKKNAVIIINYDRWNSVNP